MKRVKCVQDQPAILLAGKAKKHKFTLTDHKTHKATETTLGVDVRGNWDPEDIFCNVCKTAFANVNLICKHMESFTVNGFSLL